MYIFHFKMIYNKLVFVVLMNVIILQCCLNTAAYTRISTNGDTEGDDNDAGPKIYKAVNYDIIFPKSFNSSENVISTTPAAIPSPKKTATSVFGHPYYHLPQSTEPTYTAATGHEKLQAPILFVTPATIIEPTPLPTTSNEADTYDTQQNMNNNKDNAQVVTHNAINMQQKQQQNNNDKDEKEQQQYYASGRAVDYRTSNPFGQVITPFIKNAPRPVYRKPITTSHIATYPTFSSLAAVNLVKPSNVGKTIIYPQAKYQPKPPSKAETDKLRGKGEFKDRFSPSEGVASYAFKANNGNSHDHAPYYNEAGKISAPTNNLYAFPPSNINYPTQTENTKVALPSGSGDSYSWPASGPLKNFKYNLDAANSNSNPYQYNGPTRAHYLPPENNENSESVNEENKNNDQHGDDDLDDGVSDDSVGVLPASAMNQENSNGNGEMSSNTGGGQQMINIMNPQDDNKSPDNNSYDTEKEYPTPPPGWLNNHPESATGEQHHDHQPKKPNIEFDYDHNDHRQPDIIFNQNHHSFPSYPSHPIYHHHHHHPEIIYDDYHHDHPHIAHPPPTTTTEVPPPEPRVKKYSYFYIGRKLWYIPLYFTVWFSFYVLWLILKSIARHKVNLPNHYVSRRSLQNYDLSRHKENIINQLTTSVLNNIDKFKRKYMIL